MAGSAVGQSFPVRICARLRPEGLDFVLGHFFVADALWAGSRRTLWFPLDGWHIEFFFTKRFFFACACCAHLRPQGLGFVMGQFVPGAFALVWIVLPSLHPGSDRTAGSRSKVGALFFSSHFPCACGAHPRPKGLEFRNGLAPWPESLALVWFASPCV